MTTTAHEDQFTTGTQTIEPVRHPYSTEAILRRNVADLELALRTQTERAEKAEAELKELAQQKPVAHIDYWKSDGTLIARRQETSGGKLYAAPVHAPAVLSVSSNVLEMLDGVFADTATGQKYLSEARALLQSAEVRHD